MASRASRVAMIAGGILIIWITTAAILTKIIPAPHRNTDYLVIGAIATFLSMGVLFAVLLQSTRRPGEPIFGLRRAKSQAPDAGEAAGNDAPTDAGGGSGPLDDPQKN